MPAEAVRRVAAGEAEALLARLELPALPGTLQPRYVEADARRDPRLQPAFLVFQDRCRSWLHGLHLTDVGTTGWRDASSPYGYGGPVCNSDDAAFLQAAWAAYVAWMRAQQVVVEYVRFHPLLANDRHYGGTVADNREVVEVDLTADFAAAYPARLRHSLKKAAQGGLSYSERPLAGAVPAFGAYYRAAMAGIAVDPFYLFDDGYFAGLADTGAATLATCQRPGADGSWLAAALLLEGRGTREYHLAATTAEGRQYAASSFLLHQAALAGRERGQACLYLGGGTDARADNPLLFFKGQFSPRRRAYRTGATVFAPDGYAALQRHFAEAWAAHPGRPIFYRKV